MIKQNEKIFYPIRGIVGYNKKLNTYLHFKIVSKVELPIRLCNDIFKTYNFCAIDGETIIFSKKSGCKKLFIY